MKITDLLDRRSIEVNGSASSKEDAINKTVPEKELPFLMQNVMRFQSRGLPQWLSGTVLNLTLLTERRFL